VLLGQLSFALYMVHLFFVILPNRFLPRLFAASGQADWVAPGRHTFGLESIDPPHWWRTCSPSGWPGWRWARPGSPGATSRNRRGTGPAASLRRAAAAGSGNLMLSTRGKRDYRQAHD
jgi:hypothetical protein